VVGAVSVLSLQKEGFDEHAVSLVRTLASQTAAAVARIRARPVARQWSLEALLEGVPDALLLLDPGGDILLHNRAAQGLLPLLTGDDGQPGATGQVRSPQLAEAVAELLAGHGDVVTELEVPNDGRPRTFSLRLTQLSAQTGEQCAVAHLREVTHERVLETQAFRSAKLASIGELAAGVAHELNNPLTTILGFADLLLRAPLQAKAKGDIEKIHAAALRSRKIAHDVLSFARGSTPGVKVFDLNDALALPIRLVAKHFRADDIEIIEAFDPALQPIHGDMGQLQQVLLNLLQNAYHAISASGVGSCVIAATRAAGRNAVVEVKDDGPGMPDELRHKIFEPFFTTKPPGEGTGLGLSIVHRIITEHRGTISVAPRPSGGTCFTIELPVEPVTGQAGDGAAEMTHWTTHQALGQARDRAPVSAAGAPAGPAQPTA
jgi:two-component system NtrC family sensor kinase